MFVSKEGQVSKRGVLIPHPAHGMSYQVAGALQRLGTKMIGLSNVPVSVDKIKHIPMPYHSLKELKAQDLHDIGFVLLSCDHALGTNTESNLDELYGLWQQLLNLDAELIPLWILPASTTVFTPYSRGIHFFAPPLFGFRDQGLFEHTLFALRNKLNALYETESVNQEMNLLSMADAVSFVVSAAQNHNNLIGKSFLLPFESFTLTQWKTAFLENFAPQSKKLLQLFAKISRSGHFEKLPLSNSISQLAKEALSPLEIFPTALTPMKRVLRDLARHHSRNPEMELVFPPSRSV